GWRLLIVLLAAVAFMVYTFYLTGSSLAEQAQAMRSIVETQVTRIGGWMQQLGITATPEDFKSLASQAMSSMGRVTAAVGTAVGALTSGVMMLVLAIFIAVEPKLYERGVAWMLPMEKRANFYVIADKMGWTLRRLMFGRLIGMTVEGVGVWVFLWAGGVPMAGLLGILTGLFAFLPNIGAIISGVLIILVGFSAGVDVGLYALGVYIVVQIVDGYLIVPMVAKRATDLAPALVLAAQILFGALFGIMGLFLADPIVAMIKVYLEERSKTLEAKRGSDILKPGAT
ncbi:MAG: AI-2E family transporter, partial [bacterium]|nr:AI-2E family transporter [bacterium]